MNIENFKPIPEYPKYLIDTDGNVFSTKSNKILKTRSNENGYIRIMLTENGRTINLLLHRVLARVFLDLPSLDSDLEVDHKNRVTSDNALNNLQVMSTKDHKAKTLSENNLNDLSCKVCGKSTKAVSKICKECQIISDGITADVIIETLSLYGSWVKAAKSLGMSDNGLRKRYTKLTGLHYSSAAQLSSSG